MKVLLPKLILVVGIVLAWGCGIWSIVADDDSTEEIEKQIAEYEELETYVNALDLYDQMIAAYPDKTTWYVRKANAYYQMEAYKSYVTQCETIVSTFPSDVTGYAMLIEYYSETEDYDGVFETYYSASEELRATEELADVFAQWEYYYVYESSAYTSASAILADYGLIQSNGLYGYADADGSSVIDCQYEDARPILQSGTGDDGEDTTRAAVYQDGEWFVIDADGYRTEASFDDIEDLYSPSEGFVLAEVDGVYGYYDANLKNAQHFEYEDATCFYNGVAAVKKDGVWMLIDTSFNQVGSETFEDVVRDESNVCSRKGYVFAMVDGEYRLFDLEGNRVGSQAFEDAKLFYGDLAAVQQGGLWGFIDTSGEVAIECAYEDAQSFKGGMAAVQQNDLWGFIDEDGTMVVEPLFYSASVLSEDGVVSIGLGETCRYIRFCKFEYAEDE